MNTRIKNIKNVKTPTLHIFPHQRYVGGSCALNCFMLSSLPCFYAFCWSAIPTSCYSFNVFYSCSCHFFAWTEVCHLLQSSKSPLTGFLMQYWLKNHWLSSNTPHTDSISNSAILRNNYILLLSDLCACIHVEKKWRRKGSQSSSLSGSNCLVWLQTCEKVMGWCTAQWKMLLFCTKIILKESRKFELARLVEEEEEGELCRNGLLYSLYF